MDQTISVDWALTFLPVWIFDALLLGCLAIDVFLNKEENSANEDHNHPSSVEARMFKLMKKWIRFFVGCLVLVLQILIVLRLDRVITWSLLLVFIPYFVVEFISILQMIYVAQDSLERMFAFYHHAENTPDDSEVLYQKAKRTFVNQMLQSFLHVSR